MQVLTVNYTAPDAAAKFCESLKNTGFAVLTHHPIPPRIIDNAYAHWQAFFASDDKLSYRYQKPTQDGYFPFRTENAKDSKVSDLKEFFHYYPWGKMPPALLQDTRAVYDSLYDLSIELLAWVENHLPVDVATRLSMPLNQMIDRQKNTLLRILHYPALTDDHEPGAQRSAPHEDINFITLLPTATAPGLEVKDVAGNWHAVACDPGSIVVNVGDMLQLCTERYYKSTTHRVTNPRNDQGNVPRYSMPFFLHGRDEVMLAPEQNYAACLNQRLREIGIY